MSAALQAQIEAAEVWTQKAAALVASMEADLVKMRKRKRELEEEEAVEEGLFWDGLFPGAVPAVESEEAAEAEADGSEEGMASSGAASSGGGGGDGGELPAGSLWIKSGSSRALVCSLDAWQTANPGKTVEEPVYVVTLTWSSSGVAEKWVVLREETLVYPPHKKYIYVYVHRHNHNNNNKYIYIYIYIYV